MSTRPCAGDAPALAAETAEACDGSTPAGAREGHEAIVRALMEAGADVNKPWDDGATPLYIAAQKGHEAIVRALIELGADVNKATDDWRDAVVNCRSRGPRGDGAFADRVGRGHQQGG